MTEDLIHIGVARSDRSTAVINGVFIGITDNKRFGGSAVFQPLTVDRLCSANGSEIGIHAVRGGTITGEHEVIFAGHDEIIKISHSARSKELFATGAINAAKFICGKPAGLYNMADMLK